MRKDQRIETLRGIALLLMVSGHVIGVPGRGMKVEADSAWRFIYFALFYIRIPLYTVISGYIYALTPVQGDNWSDFLAKKLRRLMVPLLFVGTSQYLFQCFITSVNSPEKIEDIWRIYLFSYDHFWYLQALLIIFSIISLADRYKWFDKFSIWLVALAASALPFLFPPSSLFFSLKKTCYLLPFFLLGYGLFKFSVGASRSRPLLAIVVAVFVLSFALQLISFFVAIPVDNHRHSLLSLVVGLSATTLLIFASREVGWLATLGKFSYSVFLWHIFATAGSRILLARFLGFGESLVLTFISGFLLGIAFPVFIEKIAARNRWFNFLCLGTSLKKVRHKSLTMVPENLP